MKATAASLLDLLLVLVFAALGRRSHEHGVTLAGVAETAWPFIAGAATGWLLAGVIRLEPMSAPFGAVVVAGAVIVGMLLRQVTGAGTAWSFVLVATLVLSALLIGWRLIAFGPVLDFIIPVGCLLGVIRVHGPKPTAHGFDVLPNAVSP